MGVSLLDLGSDADFVSGILQSRSNRFVVEVELDDGRSIEAYFPNTGGKNLTTGGESVLVRHVADPDRRTDFDVVFVRDGVWVSAIATMANRVFETAVSQGLLPWASQHEIRRTEPPLPDGGRADFELRRPDGTTELLEVKSCTLVEHGIAKFPDAPTERGRRHVRTLQALDQPARVVFVVQRGDADRFAVNRSVDSAFATALEHAKEATMPINAFSVQIDPPTITLDEPELPIEI